MIIVVFISRKSYVSNSLLQKERDRKPTASMLNLSVPIVEVVRNVRLIGDFVKLDLVMNKTSIIIAPSFYYDIPTMKSYLSS